MVNAGFGILELGGYAWECAIENTLEILSKTSFRILTMRNDWEKAQCYALEKNLRFDVNGNMIKE